MDVDAAPAAAASPEAVAEAADKDWQRLAAGLNLKNVAMLPAALHIWTKPTAEGRRHVHGGGRSRPYLLEGET